MSFNFTAIQWKRLGSATKQAGDAWLVKSEDALEFVETSHRQWFKTVCQEFKKYHSEIKTFATTYSREKTIERSRQICLVTETTSNGVISEEQRKVVIVDELRKRTLRLQEKYPIAYPVVDQTVILKLNEMEKIFTDAIERLDIRGNPDELRSLQHEKTIIETAMKTLKESLDVVERIGVSRSI